MTVPLVLLRHGQSAWNLENRFTGWVDVDLSEQGRAEAVRAARLLVEGGFTFDSAFTSVLRRAIRTLWITLDAMDLMWLPVERSWRLNERHYGALQGLDKTEMVRKFGAEQVRLWRRSYAVPPPPLPESDRAHPRHDRRYADVDPALLPAGESLKDTCARVLPYFRERIGPEIRRGRRILVTAHGNSLRALVMHLDGMSEDAIAEMNIPTGFPLVYELDADLRPASRRYLGDAAELAAATDAVRAQTEKPRG